MSIDREALFERNSLVELKKYITTYFDKKLGGLDLIGAHVHHAIPSDQPAREEYGHSAQIVFRLLFKGNGTMSITGIQNSLGSFMARINSSMNTQAQEHIRIDLKNDISEYHRYDYLTNGGHLVMMVYIESMDCPIGFARMAERAERLAKLNVDKTHVFATAVGYSINGSTNSACAIGDDVDILQAAAEDGGKLLDRWGDLVARASRDVVRYETGRSHFVEGQQFFFDVEDI